MTDPGDVERLDIVDPSDGRRIRAASRHEVHADGHWHQVFHCLIVRPSAGTAILQERSAAKIAFPGRLDLSVTGHLTAGEVPVDGIRELTEELGVTVDADRLVPLGTRLLAAADGEGVNRERTHVFLLPDDRPLTGYAPDPAEVSAVIEVAVDDLLGCLLGGAAPARRMAATGRNHPGLGDRAGGIDCSGAAGVAAVDRAGGADGVGPADRTEAGPTTVSADALVPAVDGYWTVLLVMAQRYLAGQRPLAI